MINFRIGKVHFYISYLRIGYFKMYMTWRELHVVSIGWLRISWPGKDQGWMRR